MPTGLIDPIYTVHVGPGSRGGRGESGHATFGRRNPSEKACHLAPINAPKGGTCGFDFDFPSIHLQRVSGPHRPFHLTPRLEHRNHCSPFFFFYSFLFCSCCCLSLPYFIRKCAKLHHLTYPALPCAVRHHSQILLFCAVDQGGNF